VVAKAPSARDYLLAVEHKLRQKLPLYRHTRVIHSKRLTYDYGYCQFDRRGFRVVVNLRIADDWSPKGRGCTVGEMTDTLCHEWAHALAWQSGSRCENHDAAWGRAYAKVYRLIFEP